MSRRRPSYADISRVMNDLYYQRDQAWAGVPMAIPGLTLQLEPKSPHRAMVTGMEAIIHEGDPPPDQADLVLYADDVESIEGWTVRNGWYSTRLGREIALATDGTRVRIAMGPVAHARRATYLMRTMMASTAWTLETEISAVERLATLLKPHLFQAYFATGMFLETSPRSQVTYLFRRCRPTMAIRDKHVLCALCLHPLAYYQGSYAGGMCPTDDVMAHLLLMRADERLFWRRANQHPSYRPESGI